MYITINGIKIAKEVDEDDGSTSYELYISHFKIWNPYIGAGWFEDDAIKTQTIIEWTRAYVGYDGLTNKEYYAGQEAIKYMADKYSIILGYNKPILSEELVVELLKEVEEKYQELFKRVSNEQELEYAKLYIDKLYNTIKRIDAVPENASIIKSCQARIYEMNASIEKYRNDNR